MRNISAQNCGKMIYQDFLGGGQGMQRTKDLKKMIRLTGERAKLDAKANNIYVVYRNDHGSIIKEFADGTKLPVNTKEENKND